MSKAPDLFVQINNAVLDLQASSLQTFETPLKTLARLLHHPDLEAINQSLVERVDFEAFMEASERTGGHMAGDDNLVWPDDHEQVLGLRLIMIDKLAERSHRLLGPGRAAGSPASATNSARMATKCGRKIATCIGGIERRKRGPTSSFRSMFTTTIAETPDHALNRQPAD